MPAVYVETYGCQMNLADTELLLGHLTRSGYIRTEDAGSADLLLINTCTIREHAEERVMGRLGELARYKSQRPDVKIGLAGCMAQHLREKLMKRVPFVDFVVGPDSYRRLPEMLAQGDAFVDVRLGRDETYADIAPRRAPGVRAWITVMRGCNRFCTFCVVPYVRGRERSLPVEAVLGQVRMAAADGYREVVFLGQTVNAYRDGDVEFADLLRRANAVADIERIRFTSPHPADMSERVIDAMADCEKVCPQLHLPVQSGSDKLLQRMERGYTADQYLELVGRLRAARPGLALSTDIMVGFPGETDRDFEATCELMRTVRYDSAFMFKYSRRAHTKSFHWKETVDENEKAHRLQALIALEECIAGEINRSQIGMAFEVLVEGAARRGQGWLAGKTPQFKTAVFPAAGARVGESVAVRVTGSTAHTLVGEVAGQPGSVSCSPRRTRPELRGL